MQFNPDETFWDDLLTYVDSGCVIPVLGQGAITYGDSDQPFYPWLARRLAEKLRVSVPEDAPAPSLNDIVCRHLLAGGGSNLVYLRLSQILVAECPEPGPALRAFAEMEPFRLFLTTTFDPLLVRALNTARFGGQPRTTVGAFAPSADDQCGRSPRKAQGPAGPARAPSLGAGFAQTGLRRVGGGRVGICMRAPTAPRKARISRPRSA